MGGEGGDERERQKGGGGGCWGWGGGGGRVGIRLKSCCVLISYRLRLSGEKSLQSTYAADSPLKEETYTSIPYGKKQGKWEEDL